MLPADPRARGAPRLPFFKKIFVGRRGIAHRLTRRAARARNRQECTLTSPSRFGLATVSGRWEARSAGGGPHLSTFPLNPAYRLAVPQDSIVLLTLHVPDGRLERCLLYTSPSPRD